MGRVAAGPSGTTGHENRWQAAKGQVTVPTSLAPPPFSSPGRPPSSRTLPLILLVPPQPVHQDLVGNPMVTPYSGPQTARIVVADGRIFAQGAHMQEGGAGAGEQVGIRLGHRGLGRVKNLGKGYPRGREPFQLRNEAKSLLLTRQRGAQKGPNYQTKPTFPPLARHRRGR